MQNSVVSRSEWLKARKDFLAKEKELTRQKDALNQERLALPWVKVEKEYIFEGPKGSTPLAELFGSKDQLLIYHFMFGPDWSEGCVGCSFMADHFDGTLAHLNHHDVTLVAVSRGTLEQIEAYKARMNWQFPWVSSYAADFNHDYRVSFTQEEMQGETINYNFRDMPTSDGFEELPGLSAFYKNEPGEIFHTYSTYARGPEEVIGTLMLLDRAPLGRNEDKTMSFLKRHDEYAAKPEQQASSCCH